MKRTKFNKVDLGAIEIADYISNFSQFKNLLPGSIHNIVPPPKGASTSDDNWKKGIWVMGVSRPVLLLFTEFKKVKK